MAIKGRCQQLLECYREQYQQRLERQLQQWQHEQQQQDQHQQQGEVCQGLDMTINVAMIEFHELMEAYLECRRHKQCSMAALAFDIDLEDNLLRLYRELVGGTYSISPAVAFVVEYPVTREVFAADFRDRVVHHLLMSRLIPHFEREFIYDSYACRSGRGTLFGIRRVRRFVAQCSKGYTQDCYILKCDISGFFMNIDRQTLWRMLETFISNLQIDDSEFILDLTRQIVMHDPTNGCRINGSIERWSGVIKNKSLFGTNGKPMPGRGYGTQLSFDFVGPKGLPIGNLTSQWFGNFYLNQFDHYVKHTLGVRYYGRYVDDFVIVHPEREYLKELIPLLSAFLQNELMLQLHPQKRYLQHYSKGVGFLGVNIRRGALHAGRRIRAGSYRSVGQWNELSANRLLTSAELEGFRNSINSYWGIMRHYNSYKLRRAMAGRFCSQINNRVLYEGYRKIELKDYSISGKNIMVPYFEFDKLKKRDK